MLLLRFHWEIIQESLKFFHLILPHSKDSIQYNFHLKISIRKLIRIPKYPLRKHFASFVVTRIPPQSVHRQRNGFTAYLHSRSGNERHGPLLRGVRVLAEGVVPRPFRSPERLAAVRVPAASESASIRERWKINRPLSPWILIKPRKKATPGHNGVAEETRRRRFEARSPPARAERR